MRRWLLRGDDEHLALALDRLQISSDVRGVIERAREIEVWIDGMPEAAVLALDDLAIDVIELPLDERRWTGFEADRPIFVADDLLVRPPWVKRPADFRGIELVVPRGMAFGSGEHGSTQAALGLMHALWTAPAPRRFADIGTGSGILAAYAQLRGAVSIVACDLEVEAVDAARRLLVGAEVLLGDAGVLPPRAADFVVANLDARQLTASLDAILRAWSAADLLLLSGMRDGEDAAIAARVPAPVVAVRRSGGFIAVAFRAPGQDAGAPRTVNRS